MCRFVAVNGRVLRECGEPIPWPAGRPVVARFSYVDTLHIKKTTGRIPPNLRGTVREGASGARRKEARNPESGCAISRARIRRSPSPSCHRWTKACGPDKAARLPLPRGGNGCCRNRDSGALPPVTFSQSRRAGSSPGPPHRCWERPARPFRRRRGEGLPPRRHTARRARS